MYSEQEVMSDMLFRTNEKSAGELKSFQGTNSDWDEWCAMYQERSTV